MEPMTDERLAEIRKQMAYELLNHLDDGGIPGTVIRWEGREIWIHTTGQVEGWLRAWLEHEAITSVSDSEHIADLTDELTQARDELREAKAVERRLRTANTRMQELIVLRTKERDRLAEQVTDAETRVRAMFADHDDAISLDRLTVNELTEMVMRAVRSKEA